jgi:hypothetical protein
MFHVLHAANCACSQCGAVRDVPAQRKDDEAFSFQLPLTLEARLDSPLGASLSLESGFEWLSNTNLFHVNESCAFTQNRKWTHGSALGLGVYSVSNRNEYQKH